MPQKRNPYALSVLRGHSAVMLGKVSELFALMKSPSARSDNLIFAYGKVPRAMEAAQRATRLLASVIADMAVHAERMRASLEAGFSQATDLAEHIMARAEVDYRSAYLVAGEAVQRAAHKGLRGVELSTELVDEAACEVLGRPIGLADNELRAVLDPESIVASRTGAGGAAPEVVREMAADCRGHAERLRTTARERTEQFDDAEARLVTTAETLAGRGTASAPPSSGGGTTPPGTA
jgi:argininosuccinate lyase